MRETKEINYESYLELLRRRVPFALSRWGDGEWIATLGPGHKDKANTDGTKYTDELTSELRRTLHFRHDHPYFYGILNIAKSNLEPRINNWLAREISDDLTWVDGDVLLDASLRGDLLPFVHQVNSHRNILYVGPSKIKKPIVSRFFPKARYLEIHPSDALSDRKRIEEDIRRTRPSIVLFSAGMAANVIMYDVWRMDDKVTMIDCGSMFDGYAGVKSRSYIHRYDWQRLLEVNTGVRKKANSEAFRLG